MKTRLVFLFMLIVCFSCGTNNKPLSEAQKEKIKEEVKKEINSFIKGCEEANFDIALEPFLDSPDFIVLFNGRTYNYKELMDMKPSFNTILNQKYTMVDEKYSILDNSTVVYNSNCRWEVNYKDGHTTIEEPNAFTFILQKIEGRWRITYYTASYIEKVVKYKEQSKGLNQVELMKKWIGTWKSDITKDTSAIWVETSYGTGLEGVFKFSTKGNTYLEGKEFAGYDKKMDKYIAALMNKGNDIEIHALWFTSNNKCVLLPLSEVSNPETASFRLESTFVSPDIEIDTIFINSKPVKTQTWRKIK